MQLAELEPIEAPAEQNEIDDPVEHLYCSKRCSDIAVCGHRATPEEFTGDGWGAWFRKPCVVCHEDGGLLNPCSRCPR